LPSTIPPGKESFGINRLPLKKNQTKHEKHPISSARIASNAEIFQCLTKSLVEGSPPMAVEKIPNSAVVETFLIWRTYIGELAGTWSTCRSQIVGFVSENKSIEINVLILPVKSVFRRQIFQ